MLGKLYRFASQPRAVDPKRKYRVPEDDATQGNLMYDRRVVRGSNYAGTAPSPEQEQASLQKTREAQRRRLMRAKQTQRRPTTPEPPPGRRPAEVQTESFLEELTDRAVEFEAETQTDLAMNRPLSPLFMPAKIGVDCETQIEEGELFDFDVECEPILEVLVGKTLEQGMMEVLEEEELRSLREHQQEFERRRNAELLEVQRIEAAEVRRQGEMQRRLQQQQEQRKQDLSLMRKVVARTVATEHLSSLRERAMAHLHDAGIFADAVELGVETAFMPALLESVSQQLRQNAVDEAQLRASLLRPLVDESLTKHERVLEAERRRLRYLDEVEREVRKEAEEEKGKRDKNIARIQREQARLRKFDSIVRPKPKVTDFVIERYDGEFAYLDDGRRVAEFADESLKDELSELFANLKEGIGERAVCNITTDPDFESSPDADPTIAQGAKITSIRKFRVNSFYLDIVEARGLRDYPVDAYVVLKDVEGLVGDEKQTERVLQTEAPQWNQRFDLPVTFKLTGLEFEIRDANPERRREDGTDDVLMTCKLPVDMLYEAYGQRPPGEEMVELDSWLNADKAPDGSSQGQLHVQMRARFNIPIMIPGGEIELPNNFQIGLAWEFINKDQPVDLDASLVGLNSAEKIVDQVWYNKLEGFNGAVSHSGDDRSGEGDGDDETITIDLARLPPSIEKLVVVVNAYEEQPLDECVSFAHVRLIVGGTSYGFYSMGEGWIPKCTGIFFGVVARTNKGGWKFVTTAVAADGSTYEDSMPKILEYGKKNLGW